MADTNTYQDKTKAKPSLTAQAVGFLLGSIIVGFGFTAGAACFKLLMF